MRDQSRTLVTGLAAWLIACCALAETPAPGASPLTFEADIRPILRRHCFDCHGSTDELKGNLDLRLARLMLTGGDSGPAIVAGNPDESLLLERIRSGEMPPNDSHLSADEITLVEQWIARGAPTARPEPEAIGPGVGITVEDRSNWAFQPIRRPAIPAVSQAHVETPLDAFLLQAMPEGSSFNDEAAKLTLLRRATLDLIGLPPTETQIERFMNDTSAEAYERLLDELLASPQYGERWARHWLDIAGYADSDGYTTVDQPRSWTYKYRDYVIRSLNSDKPLSEFLLEQLAGDELAGPITGDLTPQQVELFTATGFLRMAADGTGSGADSPEARNQTIADTLKILGTSLFGLTIGCAQCHDHRYDPLPQADYYSLRAIFEPALNWQQWQPPQQRLISLYTAAERQKAAEIDAQLVQIQNERQQKQDEYLAAALEQELQKYEESQREALRTAFKTAAEQRTPEQKELVEKHPSLNITPGVLYQYNQAAADDLKKYVDRSDEVRKQKPVEEFIHALVEPAGATPATHVFHRGDYRQPKDVVPPAVPQVLCPEGQRFELPADDSAVPTSGRRLAFARWLTSRDNPITARVMVNRIWMLHFGRGIVETPGDFGKLGTMPTHPELLDWLADEFIARGWSLKQLHKVMMLSRAYRQSTVCNPAKMAMDSSNRFYSRKSVTRLDAETIRDSMLQVTRTLDVSLFGPPLSIKEDETGQVVVDGTQHRRSIYIQARRSQPVAMLQAFDAPVMETNCERRTSSTVATQSLMLLNGEFILQQADLLAQRAMSEAPGKLDSQLWQGLYDFVPEAAQSPLIAQAAYALQCAYCRPPRRDELELASSYLQAQVNLYSERTANSPPENVTPARQALTNFCHVLLSSNEFLYVD